MNRPLQRALLALVLLGGVALACLNWEQFDTANLESWVAGAGVAGALLSMVVYAMATVLIPPGPVLTLAGGALTTGCWRSDLLMPRVRRYCRKQLGYRHFHPSALATDRCAAEGDA